MLKQTLAVVGLAAFALSASVAVADQADADAAIAAAKEAVAAAAAVGGEWRDAGKMLSQAEAAVGKGDFGMAVKLANTAQFQGDTGKAQMEAQAGIGNPGYL